MNAFDIEQAVFHNFVSLIQHENCAGPLYGVLQAANEARPIRIMEAGRVIQVINTPEELIAHLEKLLAALEAFRGKPPETTKDNPLPDSGSITV